MICTQCKDVKHDKCKGGTWCDCQHQTTGVNWSQLAPGHR